MSPTSKLAFLGLMVLACTGGIEVDLAKAPSPATVLIYANTSAPGTDSWRITAMAANGETLMALAGSELVAITVDEVEWRLADFGPEHFGDWSVSVNAISSWSGGLIAAGVDYHGNRPVVWHHRGDHFERDEIEPVEGPGGHVVDVARFREGLVAVGHSEVLSNADERSRSPVVWVSADGSSWSRIEVPAEEWSVELSHVIAGDQGLVALGLVTELDEPQRSADSTFPPPDELDNFREPFAWLSSDGQSWTRVDLPTEEAVLYDLAATPFGFVAVGHSGITDLSPVILISPDGQSWSQVPADHLGDDAVLEVTSHGEWTYAIGDKVLVSQDGVDWFALDSPGSFRAISAYEGKVFAAHGSEVIELPFLRCKTGKSPELAFTEERALSRALRCDRSADVAGKTSR